MDALAIHPYPDDSSVPPTLAHPNNDVRSGSPTTRSSSALLGKAFDGHRPAGLDAADPLRRVRRRDADPRGEGVPLHGHRAGDDEADYRGDAGHYYRQAMEMSFCQPERHRVCCSSTRSTRPRSTASSRASTTRTRPPKSSLRRRPCGRARRPRRRDREVPGPRADAEGEGDVSADRVGAAGTAAIGVTCDLDCTIFARLERLPRAHDHAGRARRRQGRASGHSCKFRDAGSRPGRYRFTVRLTAPVNRGEPQALASGPLVVRLMSR